MKFSDLNLEESVLQAIEAMNFQECTPVQEHTIPVILEGHDLIGVAQTGTGKTAAYLLPILNQLSKGGYPEDSINCIIMAPTRELAQQIDQQMEGFSYFMPASSVPVYGGNDGAISNGIFALSSGVADTKGVFKDTYGPLNNPLLLSSMKR